MPNVPLSPAGMQQAQDLAARIAALPISAVVASPVQRAQQTALPIAAGLDLPLQSDPGFDEIDFGAWTGRRFTELETDPAWHAWNKLRTLAACPGGETMHQAQSRALLALSRWRLAHPGQQIVVVSHADILKALLASALGLSLDRLYRLTLDPASTSTLVVFDEDVRVECINVGPRQSAS